MEHSAFQEGQHHLNRHQSAQQISQVIILPAGGWRDPQKLPLPLRTLTEIAAQHPFARPEPLRTNR
jgi:hypothetical protein